MRITGLLQAKPATGKGRYMIMTVFFIEHILFLLIYVIRLGIKSKQTWATTYIQRREYKKKIKI